jgi:hypothetical protein
MMYRSDGQIFRADTATELVRQLHETSMTPAEDDWAWMEQTAKRTWEVTGVPIRFGTPEEFVRDMMKAKILEEEVEGEEEDS